MTQATKEFIETHIDLIEENNFEELYSFHTDEHTGELTSALIRAGFNPLKHVIKVPINYMYLIDTFVDSEGTLQPFRQLNIPSNIYIIGSSAFYNCANLEEVWLEEGVQFIDDAAFAECYALSFVHFPSTLEKLGCDTFAETGLTEVVIPDAVKVLPRFCFEQCNKLQKVVLGKSVKVIGRGCFGLCPSLYNVKLNEGLEKIEEYAFKQCRNLKKIYIPESVTTIDETAFYITDVTIQCKENTPAHKFALKYKYNYELI